MIYHPDSKDNDPQKFLEIKDAYDYLMSQCEPPPKESKVDPEYLKHEEDWLRAKDAIFQ